MASTYVCKRTDEPLIAVIGATGTGKSKLAVELAKRFNGEVINGDAVQMYQVLPIITNQISEEEKDGIPHHLLGHVGLHEPTWVVSTFVREASRIVKEIRSRGRLPILVGGTHYYTQSLLFHDALAGVHSDGTADRSRPPEEEWPSLSQPTDVLLEELRKVDPVMASKWHPNDRRKIQTSLMIYLQNNRPASDIYAEQVQSQRDDDSTTLRYPALIFWTYAENETLRPRLDARVDKMVETGLIEEVHELRQTMARLENQGVSIDESRGIWVSIGFKEFKPYLDAMERNEEALIFKHMAQGVERTKIATRQYSKSQLKWIRIKLLKALQSAKAQDALYLLDGTDISRFDEDVVGQAAAVADVFLQGRMLPPPRALSSTADAVLGTAISALDGSSSDTRVVRHCNVCQVTCATEAQWRAHTMSNAHRKLSKNVRQAEPCISDH